MPHGSASAVESLYLVPASAANIWTLEEGVDRDTLQRFLGSQVSSEVFGSCSGERARCWAMTESRKTLFEAMRAGDHVLLTLKGSGSFGFRGRVCGKCESLQLGNHLWEFVPGKPWKLIYFLHEFRQSSIPKQKLLTTLGFKRNFLLPGVVRVRTELLERAVRPHGSVDGLLSAAAAGRALGTGIVDDSRGRAAPARESSASYVAPPPMLRPEWLRRVIDEIDVLKRDPKHQERAHEALVESFLQALGLRRFEEVVFRVGRVDIQVRNKSRTVAVIEVKRDWSLGDDATAARKQAFEYAQEAGARHVIVSNGDYYGWWDRDRGLSYDKQFQGSFRLTALTRVGLIVIERLRRALQEGLSEGSVE